VNLTRPHEDLTLLQVHLTRRRIHLVLMPEALPPTSFHPILSCCSVGFFIAFIFYFFYFLCIVNFLYFYLFFVGFYFPAMMWFDFEEEIVVGGRPLASLWFFVVLALQSSFHSGGCFTCIGLFTEFLCILHHLVQPWNRPNLLIIIFESLVITIAYCSVLMDRIQYLFLYLHYLLLIRFCCWGVVSFCFGFVVGEPTLCLFLGSLTSSSVRIRSGKVHSR
jgi:hypothetical protein